MGNRGGGSVSTMAETPAGIDQDGLSGRPVAPVERVHREEANLAVPASDHVRSRIPAFASSRLREAHPYLV